ncbi:hypothetical protein AJ80_00718 [Polytolypa hystricis UAMH7299]|uniref:Tethering factor for nuclear proteasome STS1 n=1 Tax=Polytolypa hystricis (strain UAMH7299) TaxID=1447883 RepID=A0A2B7Z2X9_POLH7|nr:hypothetical protein AJ80_00718 [Polytolypa hystricis UAMH7299]
MNSLVATPPVPPHFYEHARLSPSRSSEILNRSYGSYLVPARELSVLTTSAAVSSLNQGGSRKRKAEDDTGPTDHDVRMSASPSNSPAFSPRPLPAPRQIKRSRPNVSGRPLALSRLLETLDTDALRSVLRSMCDRHPELTNEVVHTAPRPSVSATLQVLNNYQSTLQAAIPLGRDSSSDYAYNRVRQHIGNLLEALNDFTPHFLPPNESQTSTSLSYLDGATEILHRLPRWNTPQHNLDKEAAYEEMAKAWALVIREAAKRGGGIQLHNGGWDGKLAKHNQTAGGKLQEAINALSSSLGWMGGHHHEPATNAGDVSSIRQQIMSGTYGAGFQVKVGPW